jgi:hypothetical protein
MLYRILEAHGGELPAQVKCLFANTGKEMPETLDFVRDCGEKWGVDITWVEFVKDKKPGIVVNYETASRNGEPFSSLIRQKKYIPNDRLRICTEQLKVIPINFYMKSQGFDEFVSAVGIRADEPRRAAKYKQKIDYLLPLVMANQGQQDISKFWEAQSFKLNLPLSEKGESPMSNCDLCFFKSMSRKMSILRENPDLADWWIEQEDLIGCNFRASHPTYKEMKIMAERQGGLFNFDDESIPCFCGD